MKTRSRIAWLAAAVLLPGLAALALPADSAAAPAPPQARRRAPRPQMRPTRERIREIQQALVDAGVLHEKPDGYWGPKTEAALRRFQEMKGLSVTGRLSARTLQELGLGSEIAGLAAPLNRSSSPREAQDLDPEPQAEPEPEEVRSTD